MINSRAKKYVHRNPRLKMFVQTDAFASEALFSSRTGRVTRSGSSARSCHPTVPRKGYASSKIRRLIRFCRSLYILSEARLRNLVLHNIQCASHRTFSVQRSVSATSVEAVRFHALPRHNYCSLSSTRIFNNVVSHFRRCWTWLLTQVGRAQSFGICV